MHKWKNTKIRATRMERIVIIRWPNGHFQRATLDSFVGPSPTYAGLLPSACHHNPDGWWNMKIFRRSLSEFGISLEECYKQDRNRTVGMFAHFLKHVLAKAQKEGGLYQGEMEELVTLLELAKMGKVKELVILFEEWVKTLGEFAVLGPRKGILRKRWHRGRRK